MKTLIQIVVLTFALAGSTGMVKAGKYDNCMTKSLHGIWDCR